MRSISRGMRSRAFAACRSTTTATGSASRSTKRGISRCCPRGSPSSAMRTAISPRTMGSGTWPCSTAGSCLERMALVPRVLEARGLDVTPGMIARLRAVQRRRDGRHPRDHPARRSRARRRRFALVRLVLRASERRSGSDVRVADRAASTWRAARSVQHRSAASRGIHRSRARAFEPSGIGGRNRGRCKRRTIAESSDEIAA